MTATLEHSQAFQVPFDLTERQQQAWDALDDPGIIDVLYGGAKGGGKSHLMCARVLADAWNIIQYFELEPTDRPIIFGWMGRKIGSDFVSTTLQTWQRIVDPRLYRLRGATDRYPRAIIIAETLGVAYGGLDAREDIQKFNSMELGRIYADQAEEMNRDEVAVLRASRRLTINGVPIPPKGLWTANPRQCWLKDDFILNPGEKRRFIPALPADNPHLPGHYIDELKEDFKHRPELLAAYLEGSWDAFDEPDQVILDRWIQAAIDRVRIQPIERRLLVADVARFGDDETVIMELAGPGATIVDQDVFGKKDTMHTAGRIHLKAVASNIPAVVVDEGGVGGGVVDRLMELAGSAYRVIPFNGAEKARPPADSRYVNRRAEAWDTVAGMFAEGEIVLDGSMVDNVLRGDLCAPKYEIRNGRILIEPKEKVKERLGRSPDRGDTYVMGVASLPDAPLAGEADRNTMDNRRRRPGTWPNRRRSRGWMTA